VSAANSFVAESPDPRVVSPTNPVTEELAPPVATAPKYRDLAPATILRAAELAARAHRDDLESATKYAKGKLHQWVGAYRDPEIRKFGRQVEEFLATPYLPHDLERFALEALKRHASTAERIGEMERIYPHLLEELEIANEITILDLCGGMHAFALPLFRGERRIRYRGFDCDGAVAMLADRFVRALSTDASVECRDVIADPPLEPCDVVWLFKAAPCLERQAEGATRRLLEQLRAKSVVLSFPTRSLGGREKGMVENYSGFVKSLADELHRSIRVIEFSSETFYVLTESRA